MVCSNCKNEFDNINGLKFCPYCGTKIEEPTVLMTEQIEETSEEVTKTQKLSDTLKMPIITKKQIRQYKREKFFNAIKKPFQNTKIVITIITLVLFMVLGGFGYSFFANRTVDEAKMKEDLIGKTIVLSQGTSIEIKKGYIKSFSISQRNTNKSEKIDDIKALITLNDGTLEVKSLLALKYAYEGNNKWTISDKVELAGDTTIKPLVGMDEKLIIEEVKKLNITVGNTEKALSEEDVKALTIASRTPDFDNLKEEVLIDAAIDSGLIAASGKIKCSLIFENEVWSVASAQRNSNEDFVLIISPAFSQEKILEVVKKDVLDLTVAHPNVFGGKSFKVTDSFTKSFNVTDKKFDAQNQNLTVTVKRQNTAGEVKSVLSSDYTFALSFSKVELLKKSKVTVDSVTIDDISKDFIVSTIVNAEIEGNNIFLWYSNDHKITAEEAKTFKTTKTSSKKGLENVKYVYGSITYKDGSKQKTTNIVAVYFLVYDSSKGYSWKLDRIVGEESSNYKMYTSEAQ
jgi:hypothetical protein